MVGGISLLRLTVLGGCSSTRAVKEPFVQQMHGKQMIGLSFTSICCSLSWYLLSADLI